MNALLLCAGLGTRLRPLTLERPKPLVPLLGHPLASFGLQCLAQAGVKHVLANTHHLGELVGPGLAPYAQRAQVALTLLPEPTLLGTGGAIRNALETVDGRAGDALLVFNGDVLAWPDLGALLEFHRARESKLTLLVRKDPRAAALGSIETDAEGRVLRILGEGPSPAVPTQQWMFTGIYAVDGGLRPDLPEEGCVVRHTLRRLLARGERVFAREHVGPWFDLGTVENYLAVHLGLLKGTLVLPGVSTPFEARSLDPRATVAPTVQLGQNLWVGAEASVEGEGLLERALLWEGARVSAPLRDTLVSTKGERIPIPTSLEPAKG